MPTYESKQNKPDRSDMQWFFSSTDSAELLRQFAVARVHSVPANEWLVLLKDKIVTQPEDYYFSSARNYAGLNFELEVIVLDLF